jgi:DNA polymerase-3 subunit chi
MNNTEVNFYQTDEVEKSLATLIVKILDEKKKALIFCQNEARVKELDNFLWSFGRNKFIPHITIFDKEFELKRQPVVISNRQENSNNADCLIFLDSVNVDFAKKFQRVFYFFDISDLEKSEKIRKEIQPTNSYKKENGKWLVVND